MGGYQTDERLQTDDLAVLRAELAAWRRAERHPRPREGDRLDLDLTRLRQARPLVAAPAPAEEYVAALRSELIDRRES